MKDLLRKAVCLSFTAHSWSISRRGDLDLIETEADKGLLRLGKDLVACEEYQAITRLDQNFYSILDWKDGQRALPFQFKRGIYLIPAAMISDIETRLWEYEKERQERVNVFIEAYPAEIGKSADRLKNQFRADDYPPAYEVARRFYIEWQWIALDTPEVLAEMDKNLYQREKAKAASQWEETIEIIKQALRDQMRGFCGEMIDRLTPKENGHLRQIRDSWLEKLQDFLATFEARDIADDVDLRVIIAEMREKMRGLPAEELRSDEQLREAIKKDFELARETLDAFDRIDLLVEEVA